METTPTKRKYFTHEKKRLILQEHFSSGISIPVLARKHGVHAITLYAWKRQMNPKKISSEIDPEFIRKLIEENDRLKNENKNLKAKVGDLSVRNDILQDGIDIIQKKVALNALGPPKKSKKIIGMR
jgi:transposase-like protein